MSRVHVFSIPNLRKELYESLEVCALMRPCHRRPKPHSVSTQQSCLFNFPFNNSRIFPSNLFYIFLPIYIIFSKNSLYGLKNGSHEAVKGYNNTPRLQDNPWSSFFLTWCDLPLYCCARDMMCCLFPGRFLHVKQTAAEQHVGQGSWLRAA